MGRNQAALSCTTSGSVDAAPSSRQSGRLPRDLPAWESTPVHCMPVDCWRRAQQGPPLAGPTREWVSRAPPRAGQPRQSASRRILHHSPGCTWPPSAARVIPRREHVHLQDHSHGCSPGCRCRQLSGSHFRRYSPTVSGRLQPAVSGGSGVFSGLWSSPYPPLGSAPAALKYLRETERSPYAVT